MKYYVQLSSASSPVHNHKYYEVIICTKGCGVCYFNDESVCVSPGKILIIPPLVDHKNQCDSTYERIWIHNDFKQFFNLESPVVINDTPSGEGTQLARLIYENRHSNPEYLSALGNAFAHFLLSCIDTGNQVHIKVREIINTIAARFSDANTDVCAILKNSGYAEDYIRSQFKKISGNTPVEFLTQIRITHACYLIDTYKSAMSLSEIAEKCGYTDYVYFSRRFKQIMGMSPKRYKDMQNT